MGTKVTFDIRPDLEVRYCLHGEDHFQLTGVTGFEWNYTAALTYEQAVQLREHLTRWLDEAAAPSAPGVPLECGCSAEPVAPHERKETCRR